MKTWHQNSKMQLRHEKLPANLFVIMKEDRIVVYANWEARVRNEKRIRKYHTTAQRIGRGIYGIYRIPINTIVILLIVLVG